jgi:hypothetical protein
MSTANIKQQILRYSIDDFCNVNYIADVLNSTSLSQVSALICKMLKSEDFYTFQMTSLFVRDAIVMGYRDDRTQRFRTTYLRSSIVKTVERRLFSDNHFIRCEAVYILGKTYCHNSSKVLIEAFHRFKDSDPLFIDGLIFEMVWLRVENVERYLELMATSSSYLTRWTVVRHIYAIDNKIPAWAEKLRQDECEHVRTAAEYECQRTLKYLQTPSLSEDDERQLKSIEPRIYFDMASSLFSSSIFKNGSTEYTVPEFETYIDSLSPGL